jgi:ribosomal protein S28E/S33
MLTKVSEEAALLMKDKIILIQVRILEMEDQRVLLLNSKGPEVYSIQISMIITVLEIRKVSTELKNT